MFETVLLELSKQNMAAGGWAVSPSFRTFTRWQSLLSCPLLSSELEIKLEMACNQIQITAKCNSVLHWLYCSAGKNGCCGSNKNKGIRCVISNIARQEQPTEDHLNMDRLLVLSNYLLTIYPQTGYLYHRAVAAALIDSNQSSS